MLIERSLRFLLTLSNSLLGVFFFASAWHQVPLKWHLAGGSAIVLLSLFTQTCVIFYFVGSGRWIKDQAQELYAHDKERALRIWKFYELANKLKGPSMPFATFSLGFGLFTFILGGATQVGAMAPWVHPTLAGLLLFNNVIGEYFARKCIRKSLEYLDQTTQELESQQTAS